MVTLSNKVLTWNYKNIIKNVIIQYTWSMRKMNRKSQVSYKIIAVKL